MNEQDIARLIEQTVDKAVDQSTVNTYFLAALTIMVAIIGYFIKSSMDDLRQMVRDMAEVKQEQAVMGQTLGQHTDELNRLRK